MQDEDYYIVFDDEADAEMARADGGYPTEFAPVVETRERLTKVEATLHSVQQTSERIEDKVDGLCDRTDEVAEESLSKEVFEEHYASEIESNARISTILKWAAAALVALATIVATLLQLGVMI